jgi:hypothetical protein
MGDETEGQQGSAQTVPDPVPFWGISTLGVLFLIFAFLVFWILIQTWPVPATGTNATGYAAASLFVLDIGTLSPDSRLFIMVAAAGALGSLIHTLTSFVDYVGNRRLACSWVWWLVLRTPIGMALALLFYLVLRGGLIVPSLPNAGAGSTSSLLNPYGFAAMAAMAGMFSKQATDKLREIFDTLFRTNQPVNRADPLARAAPAISAVTPPKVPLNSTSKELTVTGTGFKAGCKATINGEERVVQRVSDTELKLVLADKDVAAKATLQLIVQAAGPNGESSKPFAITVE